ncbi:MAG: CIS tube protein [Saccharospirillum sp.]
MMPYITRGALVEYGLSVPPLLLEFEFNPQTLSRTRTVSISMGNAPGTRGGYDFAFPWETSRVAQGVSVEPEEFSIDILIDATDRMGDRNHPSHSTATNFGIEPDLDTLRSMVEPKTQGPGGVQVLAGLGGIGGRAFARDEHPSVLLLVWGSHVLPVFLTSVQVDETAHLPNLKPYRANVNLSFQVIEGNNPFYKVEKVRQAVGAGMNFASGAANVLGKVFG